MCKYAAYVANQGLKHSTIKTYLSAVRHMQIMMGLGDPFNQPTPRLEYVLRGIKSDQAQKGRGGTRTRLPITPQLLKRMKICLMKEPQNNDNIMVWAACCVCFFGFLRAGEIVVPSLSAYDPSVHLSFGDVTLDSREALTLAQVTIKASKTDPFRKGVAIYLGRTSNELCPVTAVATHLAARGGTPGPFFQFQNGRPLTRETFVAKTRQLLEETGVNAKEYAGHSFRIGAASTAAACGVEDSLIQTLGRWESSAYLLYVRVPQEKLAQLSNTLAQAP